MGKIYGIRFMNATTTIYAIQQQNEAGYWDLLGEAYLDEDTAGTRCTELTVDLMFEYLSDEDISEIYPQFVNLVNEELNSDETDKDGIKLLAGLKGLVAQDPHPLYSWAEEQMEGGIFAYKLIKVMGLDVAN
jgi:hypothetical protein